MIKVQHISLHNNLTSFLTMLTLVTKAPSVKLVVLFLLHVDWRLTGFEAALKIRSNIGKRRERWEALIIVIFLSWLVVEMFVCLSVLSLSFSSFYIVYNQASVSEAASLIGGPWKIN